MLVDAGIVDDDVERPVLRHDRAAPGRSRRRRAASATPPTSAASREAASPYRVRDHDRGALRGQAAARSPRRCPARRPRRSARRPSRRPKAACRGRTLAPREARRALLDHGGEPFARIGLAGQFGYGACFFRQALLPRWCRCRPTAAAWSPPAPSARRRPARARATIASSPARSSGTTLRDDAHRSASAAEITGLVSRIAIARRKPDQPRQRDGDAGVRRHRDARRARQELCRLRRR